MNKEYQTTTRERISYGAFFFGKNTMMAYIGFISTYLLDIGLDARAASGILIAPKILEAVFDTLFGFIVDKTKHRNNQKFMPWIKISTLTAGIVGVIIFAIPAGLDTWVKIGWFIVAYIVFNAIYTMMDVPIYAMPTAMTSSLEEKTVLVSINRFGGLVGGTIGMTLVPAVRPLTGWLPGAVIFMFSGLVLMLPFLFFGKEKNTVQKGQEEKYTIRSMLEYVKANKYLQLSLLIMTIVSCLSVEMFMALLLARNCLGNEALGTPVMMAFTIPAIVMSTCFPAIARKYDKVHILLTGMILSCLSSIALYFIGYGSIPVIVLLLIARGFGSATFMVSIYIMIADSVEYGAFMLGTRASGITFSLQTFVGMLKNAVIGSVTLMILGMFGYDSSLAEGAIQSAEVIKGVWMIFNLLPAIGYGITAIILLFFYKMTDRDVEIMARCNNMQISREEALEKLGDKYRPK